MNLRPIDANRQAMFQPILKCAGEYRLAPFSLLLRGRGPAFHVPAFQRNHRKRLAPFFLERCCSLVPRSHVSSRSLYRSLTFTLLATLVTLMREASSTPGVCWSEVVRTTVQT